VDEKSKRLGELESYQQKISRALKSLGEKGITLRLEPTKELIVGVSRVGHAIVAGPEISRIDGCLRKEIETCMREKAKDTLNIARDACIAITSLNHDYFVTSDKCLYESWLKVIEENMENKRALEAKGHRIPRIVYAPPDPQSLAEKIMNLTK
jgi:hypothetical protein